MARAFVSASSQYLEKAAAPVTGPPLTMACWFKATSITATAQTAMAISTTATNDGQLLYTDATTGTVRAYTQTPGGPGFSAAGNVVAGTWAHLAGVWASATSRTAYKDGTAGAADTTNLSPASPDNVTVGVWHKGSAYALYADATSAEAAVWNVALDAFEIAALSAGVCPLLIRTTAIVAYWPIIGQYSPEIDVVGRYELTVTGATAAAHPLITYPTPAQLHRYGSTAAAATGTGRMFQVF